MLLTEDHARVAEVLIGIVGFSPVIDSYPLGPKLMDSLNARLADHPEVAVENMTWSPIHVVQRFQDEGAVRPRRQCWSEWRRSASRPGECAAFGGAGEPSPQRRCRSGFTRR